MRCLITSGPTFEPLDRVRRLTNFSTGALGAGLAAELCAAGHESWLLRGATATHPAPAARARLTLEEFTTTEDLADRIRAARRWKPDVIFHAAAVSDFGVGRVFQRDARGALRTVRSGKLSTRGGPLLVELVPTRKLIAHLREWFPQARLVGWKYEVDGTRQDALLHGTEQLHTCRTDAVVVNGEAYGHGFGFLIAGLPVVDLPDRPSLYRELLAWVEAKGGKKSSKSPPRK